MRIARWAGLTGCLLLAGACGGSSKAGTAPTTTVAASTTIPPTTLPVSALTITGVGPGVEQTPFYPATNVNIVACGPVPGGVFVAIPVPPGGPPTPPGSALAAKGAVIIVVNGRAVLKDQAGKDLYEMAMPSIKTAHQGSFVLSLESITYVGGDHRSVAQGAVDVSGDYTCPAINFPFPGL